VKAGFHSPLAPARTGVADYAASLLRGLRKLGDVEVDAAHADIQLYHVGNNQLHLGIYRRAIAEPGVVVLHDAVLQHLFLGSMTEAQYVDEFVYNYGEWKRGRAEQLWRDRAASATDERYFRFPMLKRLVNTSRAVIVHNRGAAEMVREHAPDAEVITIPHLFDGPEAIDPAAGFEFRRERGISLDGCLFGIFGFLRESKRVLAVLEAFAELRAMLPTAAMLVAGEFVSSDLERACAPLLAGPGVYRLPYLSERDFWEAASAIDVCINLRAPSAGETSGIAVRMMGIGKPVLLTEGAETEAFPAGAYLPVPPGIGERSALADYMGILALYRTMRSEMGRAGAEGIRRWHSIATVSSLYWNALCKSAGS
jgi:glycosyltransferase involved in cell wall biosynthesis